MIAEHRFPAAQAAADALAAALADRLRDAIAERGTALIAVSGGRSPVAVFEALAREPLDWARVIVTQVDERWVDPDHPDSNALLIAAHLLTGAASAARFVPLKNAAPTAREGQAECEAALAALPRPFDAILLGMGEDGHTASLFPEAAELAGALSTQALCAAVTPPAAPHERMTLTRSALLDCRSLHLQLSGSAKLDVYRRALGEGPIEELPVRAVLRQDRAPIDVWITP